MQPRVEASQDHGRQRVGKFIRSQARLLVAAQGAVVRIDDGFKEAHGGEDSQRGL
jgi:hypothetical protein